MPAKRLKLEWNGLKSTFNYFPRGPELVMSEKSDIWFEGYGDGAASDITIDFELLVYDI